MAAKLVVPPAVEPVSLQEAERHLRLDVGALGEDADLERIIVVARRQCEDFQNRAYLRQTWELYLDGFPACGYIDLPRPPLQHVISLSYSDDRGELHTVRFVDEGGEPLFESGGYIVDVYSEPGRLVLKPGFSWPQTNAEANSVCLRYVCGYGTEPEDVPAEIKQAILAKVADLYEHRGDEVGDPRIDQAVERLLWPRRVVPL